jgi:sodium-dependent dicarboxylate transporter 2/3/5
VMFFPTILYVVLGIAAAMVLEPPEPELAAKLRDTSAAREAYDALGPMKASEWRVLALFLILIFLWVIGAWIKLDAGFAALIIMGVLFMPGIGVLQAKALREVNWDIALIIGSGFGVAGILNETGMIKVVADALIAPVLNPLATLGSFGVALGGIIVGLIAHFMLPGPANVTLAIPLLIAWGTNIAHLPQIDVVVFLLFLSAMTSQLVAMAYQQPPYYVYLGMDITNDARFNWLLIKVWPLHTAASILASYLIYVIVKATGIGLT